MPKSFPKDAVGTRFESVSSWKNLWFVFAGDFIPL